MCAVGGTEGIKPVLINRTASVPIQEKYCHHISVLGEGLSVLSPLCHVGCACLLMLVLMLWFLLLHLCSPCVWVEMSFNEERPGNTGFEEESKHLKSFLRVQLFVKL